MRALSRESFVKEESRSFLDRVFDGNPLAAVVHLVEAQSLSPEELKGLLDNPRVRVIDIRDGASYAKEHIPGALSAPYGTWRGPATNPGELPALPKLEAQVQKLGLAPETHAVVVSSGADATDAAHRRAHWTLKYLGSPSSRC
jgi:3-mercaptopyruvate sulfurtransferase SseA